MPNGTVICTYEKKQKKAKLNGTNKYICATGISIILLPAYTFMLTNLNLQVFYKNF